MIVGLLIFHPKVVCMIVEASTILIREQIAAKLLALAVKTHFEQEYKYIRIVYNSIGLFTFEIRVY